jgi:hypothetical protein
VVTTTIILQKFFISFADNRNRYYDYYYLFTFSEKKKGEKKRFFFNLKVVITSKLFLQTIVNIAVGERKIFANEYTFSKNARWSVGITRVNFTNQPCIVPGVNIFLRKMEIFKYFFTIKLSSFIVIFVFYFVTKWASLTAIIGKWSLVGSTPGVNFINPLALGALVSAHRFGPKRVSKSIWLEGHIPEKNALQAVV